MEFKLNNLKYAWVGKELKHIASGNKYDKYFLDEDLTIPLVFCKGVKIKSYWRKEPNIDDSVIRGFFGSSESIEHYNKKIELSKSLELQFGQHLITGESSKVEYRVKSINKVIDLIFLDRNGDILVGIEVFCTNKKTDEDIKKFNQVNFPIYEYNIHTGEVYPISSGCTNTEEIKQLSREIREVETSISEDKPKLIRGKGILLRQRNRIKRLEKGFKRLTTKSKMETKKFHEEKEIIKFGEDYLIREEIKEESSIKNSIKEVRKQIADIEYEPSKQEVLSIEREVESIEYRIESINREIREVKGRIAEQNRIEYELGQEHRKITNAN